MLIAALLAAAPVPPTPPSLASPAAAAEAVRRYYALIDARRYREAYALWDRNGAASRQSFAAFRRGFAHTAGTRVVVGRPGQPEGAAGSSYVTVPVTVAARLASGRRQHFAGHYTLRRVNDVPGSSAAARRWHLSSASLQAVPQGG